MSSKPKLVILPGWGGSHETWKHFADTAQDTFDVEVIDLPCFANEPCPKTVWGVDDYAKFVAKKLPYFGKVLLLGHSFGGQVAVSVAANHPKHIEKLILSGPAVIRPKKLAKRALFWLLAKCGKLFFKLPFLKKFSIVAKKILYHGADSPDYSATSDIKRDIFRKIIREDKQKLLGEIKVPTLVVAGTKDSYVSPAFSKRIAAQIPDSTLIELKGGKHGLHNQMPSELFCAIKKFV